MVTIDMDRAESIATDTRASKRLRSAMGRLSPIRWTKGGMIFLLLSSFLGLGALLALMDVIDPDWWQPIGLVIVVVPPAIYFVALFRGMSPRQFVKTMLEHSFCPACGASMKRLTVADDGCTECRACNAAWRISRSCDACGYDLGTLPVVGRGEIQCPECGHKTRFSQRE